MAGLKEENLISLTGTLEAGQRMMKIGNSYIPIAPGGNFTPANIYIPDNYYKCASVDTVNKTWTGYKSIFNNGIYTFEATVTSGLIYTDVTPVVNGVYSANALADVTLWDGIPTNGLIFSAPRIVGAEGSVISTWGNFTANSNLTATLVKSPYSNNMGVTSNSPWNDSSDSNRFVAGMMSNAVPCTYAILFSFVEDQSNPGRTLFRIAKGIYGAGQSYGANLYISGSGQIHSSFQGHIEQNPEQLITNGEHVLVVDYRAYRIRIFLDGILLNDFTDNVSPNNYAVSMLPSNGFVLFSANVYDRVLSDEEISSIVI